MSPETRLGRKHLSSLAALDVCVGSEADVERVAAIVGIGPKADSRLRSTAMLLRARRSQTPCFRQEARTSAGAQSLGASFASKTAANRSYELAMSSIVILAVRSSS
jgi:hypothetical protein